MKMKRKPNPKLVAAIAAIIVPPAIVAFAWAIAYVPVFRLVLVFPVLWIFYRIFLCITTNWDVFKEMIKDMWK